MLQGDEQDAEGGCNGVEEREVGKRLRGHQLLGSASQSAFRLTFSMLHRMHPRNTVFLTIAIHVQLQSTSLYRTYTGCYSGNEESNRKPAVNIFFV